jgi:hypothetical protein
MRKLALVLLPLAIWLLSACSSAEAGSPAPSSVPVADKLAADETAATEACKGFVANQLKAPATAQWVDVEATLHGVDTYEVLGGVDSENGFGALVRSTFSCTTAKSGGQWTEQVVHVF